jgi:hypothetical protein
MELPANGAGANPANSKTRRPSSGNMISKKG